MKKRLKEKKIHAADLIDMDLLSKANAFGAYDCSDQRRRAVPIAGGLAAAREFVMISCSPLLTSRFV